MYFVRYSILFSIDYRRGIIYAEASLIKYDNQKNETLLDAASAGNVELVKSLIEAGADLNAKDDQGRTALLLALGNSHFDVVVELMEAGADVMATDNAGNSPLFEILDVILVLGREGAIDFLVDAGMSPADAEALVATRC